MLITLPMIKAVSFPTMSVGHSSSKKDGACDAPHKTLLLPCQPLQRMILSLWKISFVQLLGINEGHRGQCDPVYTVTLGAAPKISSESSDLLQSGLYQLTVRVTSSEIRCHGNPG